MTESATLLEAHDPFADDVARAAHPAARRTASSDDLGWRTSHVSLWNDRPHTDAFDMPESDSHLLVLVLSGRYVIESRNGGTWRHALYGPGAMGGTVAGQRSTLRWSSVTDEPLVSARIYLSAQLVDQTVAALAPHHAGAFPDTLSLDDPGTLAATRSLLWGLEHRMPSLFADSAAQVLAGHVVVASTPAQDAGGEPPLSRVALAAVVAYMHDHLTDDVSLDELAAAANLSKFHMLRCFKAATGSTPFRYLTRMRLDHAARELSTTPHSVRRVARSSGFRSERQFAAAFARQFGETPSRYRATQ